MKTRPARRTAAETDGPEEGLCAFSPAYLQAARGRLRCCRRPPLTITTHVQAVVGREATGRVAPNAATAAEPRRKGPLTRAPGQYRYRDSNPGFRHERAAS